MSKNLTHSPKSRDDFIQYILSVLGEPVINVNVTRLQIEQGVDRALQFFFEYHYNGSEQVFYVVKLSDTDISNRFITIPPEIFSVQNVYDMSTSSGLGISSNLYNGAWAVNYDMIYNNVNLTGNFSSYYINQQFFNTLQQILIAMPSIRFNMHTHRVYIDNDWMKYRKDDILVLDCYKEIDVEEYPDIWTDKFLQSLATAYVKKQWADNISKYTGTLPGGIQLNWQQLLSDAQLEINKLEKEDINKYTKPVFDCVG